MGKEEFQMIIDQLLTKSDIWWSEIYDDCHRSNSPKLSTSYDTTRMTKEIQANKWVDQYTKCIEIISASKTSSDQEKLNQSYDWILIAARNAFLEFTKIRRKIKEIQIISNIIFAPENPNPQKKTKIQNSDFKNHIFSQLREMENQSLTEILISKINKMQNENQISSMETETINVLLNNLLLDQIPQEFPQPEFKYEDLEFLAKEMNEDDWYSKLSPSSKIFDQKAPQQTTDVKRDNKSTYTSEEEMYADGIKSPNIVLHYESKGNSNSVGFIIQKRITKPQMYVPHDAMIKRFYAKKSPTGQALKLEEIRIDKIKINTPDFPEDREDEYTKGDTYYLLLSSPDISKKLPESKLDVIINPTYQTAKPFNELNSNEVAITVTNRIGEQKQ